MNTILLDTLKLESGVVLRQVPVAYRTWGALNRRGDNAIVVCHALTGNINIDEWWGGLMGPGKALDTDRFYVIAANVLGSPYGSVSPITLNPKTGEPYGASFPSLTIRDTVNAHKQLLDRLNVCSVELVIGGSMGGMQVLEWALLGDFVKHIAPIAVGGRHSAWCIAWSEAQRQAIFADPNWNGGHYTQGNEPVAGLSAARMMAMVSYRSMEIYDDRFGRARQEDDDSLWAVEGYLRYQGQKLVDRFDANCYVQLTRQMDTHDVSRGRGEYREVLNGIQQPALVIGIDSDILYPLREQEELAEHLPHSTLRVLASPQGHDAFLIEIDTLNEFIGEWLRQQTTSVSISTSPSSFQLRKNGST